MSAQSPVQLRISCQLTQRWLRSLLIMLTLTARLSVELTASVAHAHQGRLDHSPELSFEGCDLTTSSLIRNTLKRLPAKLMTLKRVQVRCVDRALPYGFSARLVSDRAELTLGATSGVASSRVGSCARAAWRARSSVAPLSAV